ncbi:PREDICTED: E3 ubiquitin-protein ligase RNF31-like [Priapulus caudatus]|uniref:E3 ubiquitin-protein ligase RNF31-like n=1 Tax=Priapulus caudatus TaxID=37621 RepID=A0ABM1FAS1_PRICU|nr:PREDICTED: E3 ubiquitin-protein ligase RNF31-like [Priapulus caudatus]
MVLMISCSHRACVGCFSKYFTNKIKSCSILELTCPFCKQPDLAGEASDEQASKYFSDLDVLLKKIVEKDTHELFQSKLRDYSLEREPRFRWCAHCSCGFIGADASSMAIECPFCRKKMCYRCRQPWELKHASLTCQEFESWKQQRNPEYQATMNSLLKRNIIDCPNCSLKFTLAKGGCMHITCSRCKHQFCSGCKKTFMDGTKCQVFQSCNKGLHAHHPRNCLFYLRDIMTEALQQLLQVNYGITFQKRLRQARSANSAQDSCRVHYTEYLAELIQKHGIDPAPLLTDRKLQAVLQRERVAVPRMTASESRATYWHRLLDEVQTKVPLT